MPISNRASESRMTTTTIHLDPKTKGNRRPIRFTSDNSNLLQTTDNYLKPSDSYQYKTGRFASNDASKTSNVIQSNESPTLSSRNPSPSTIERSNPRIFRVRRVARAPESSSSPVLPLSPASPPPPRIESNKEVIATKSVIVKDTTSRGTTPPPASYETKNQPIRSTFHYQTSTPNVHSTNTRSTRIIDSKAIATIDGEYDDDDSFIEETKTTTTVIKPIEIPKAPAVVTSTVASVPQTVASTTTTTAVVPPVETTTIRERPIYNSYRHRRIRTRSTSTLSDYSTTSTGSYTTTSTITPQQPVIKYHTILPPRPPIQTTIINDPPTTIVPERRFIHHVRRVRTNSGYYSSDLDFGKQKVYKSDYKYRHYYCCNWCQGRCDLPNSGCSCCEWFYGCPLWGLILVSLLLLALIVAFFTLLGLQPTLNSARRSQTAQTRLLNRTVIIYGFLNNCGYQANSPTTLVLCANTATTSTSRVELSSYYMTSTGTKHNIINKALIVLNTFYFFLLFSINKFMRF